MAPGVSSFGKPSVLRCSRCGKFVDWREARLQVVCECRPHLELPPVLIREATDADREAVTSLFRRNFGRTKIVAFGSVMALDDLPALYFYQRFGYVISEVVVGSLIPIVPPGAPSGFPGIPPRDEIRLEKTLDTPVS